MTKRFVCLLVCLAITASQAVQVEKSKSNDLEIKVVGKTSDIEAPITKKNLSEVEEAPSLVARKAIIHPKKPAAKVPVPVAKLDEDGGVHQNRHTALSNSTHVASLLARHSDEHVHVVGKTTKVVDQCTTTMKNEDVQGCWDLAAEVGMEGSEHWKIFNMDKNTLCADSDPFPEDIMVYPCNGKEDKSQVLSRKKSAIASKAAKAALEADANASKAKVSSSELKKSPTAGEPDDESVSLNKKSQHKSGHKSRRQRKKEKRQRKKEKREQEEEELKREYLAEKLARAEAASLSKAKEHFEDEDSREEPRESARHTSFDRHESEDRHSRSSDRSERSYDRSERSSDRSDRSYDRSDRSYDRSDRSSDRSDRSSDRSDRSSDRDGRSHDRSYRSSDRDERSHDRDEHTSARDDRTYHADRKEEKPAEKAEDSSNADDVSEWVDILHEIGIEDPYLARRFVEKDLLLEDIVDFHPSDFEDEDLNLPSRARLDLIDLAKEVFQGEGRRAEEDEEEDSFDSDEPVAEFKAHDEHRSSFSRKEEDDNEPVAEFKAHDEHRSSFSRKEEEVLGGECTTTMAEQGVAGCWDLATAVGLEGSDHTKIANEDNEGRPCVDSNPQPHDVMSFPCPKPHFTSFSRDSSSRDSDREDRYDDREESRDYDREDRYDDREEDRYDDKEDRYDDREDDRYDDREEDRYDDRDSRNGRDEYYS